jgi:thiamine-monophosphate kinase
MNIDSCGEFGLIERLKKCVTAPTDFVIIGIGDDAAAFRTKPDCIQIMTADAFVEGIHFDLSFASFRDVGWRAMAANLSDVAAAGGAPTWATVCLCVPASCTVESLEELYSGMDAVAAPFGCRIVGGDTTSSPSGLTLSIALLGEVARERMTLRSGVRPGDLFCVTGHLGGSRAGLEVLRRRRSGRPLPDSFGEPVQRYLRPSPRLKEAAAMGNTVPIHAAIDVSDGLSSEIHHLCWMSGVGALIERDAVPIHPDTRDVARLCGEEAMAFAMSGGEDFELLFAVSPGDASSATRAVSEATGTPVTVIGEATPPEEGIRIRPGDGSRVPLPDTGYAHFRGRESPSAQVRNTDS